MNIVKEIHRRKILRGESSSISSVYADVYPFIKYNKPITIDNLYVEQNKLYLIGVDDSQNSFIVITGNPPWSVHNNLQKSFDRFIFVKPVSDSESKLAGWLTDNEVEDLAPENIVNPAPSTFNFQVQDPCSLMAVWDWNKTVWQCSCGNQHHDPRTKKWCKAFMSSKSN